MTCSTVLDEFLVVVPEEDFVESIDTIFVLFGESTCDHLVVYTPGGEKICSSNGSGRLDYG